MNFSQDNLLIALILIIALGGNLGDGSILWILLILLASQGNNGCCRCTNPCGGNCGCGRIF